MRSASGVVCQQCQRSDRRFRIGIALVCREHRASKVSRKNRVLRQCSGECLSSSRHLVPRDRVGDLGVHERPHARRRTRTRAPSRDLIQTDGPRQTGRRASEEGGRERDTGARIGLSHSKEDKPRGRPQAPDVCSSLRHRLAPTRRLRRHRPAGKTKENNRIANTGHGFATTRTAHRSTKARSGFNTSGNGGLATLPSAAASHACIGGFR